MRKILKAIRTWWAEVQYQKAKIVKQADIIQRGAGTMPEFGPNGDGHCRRCGWKTHTIFCENCQMMMYKALKDMGVWGDDSKDMPSL